MPLLAALCPELLSSFFGLRFSDLCFKPLLSMNFELVSRSFELVSGSFELVSSPRTKFLCVTLGKESDHTKADWLLFAELMCVSYLEWVSYQGDPARWRH